MLSLSESARLELDAYFGGREKTPVRIYLAPGGCGGPKPALTLDTPNELDEVLQIDSYSFCVNKELLASLKFLDIDFSDHGFVVKTDKIFGGSGGCSGCSGACPDNGQSGCCSSSGCDA